MAIGYFVQPHKETAWTCEVTPKESKKEEYARNRRIPFTSQNCPLSAFSFPLTKARLSPCFLCYSCSQLCHTFCTSSFRGRSPRWGNWKPVANQAVFNFALLQRCCFFVYVCHSPFDWLYNNYTGSWRAFQALIRGLLFAKEHFCNTKRGKNIARSLRPALYSIIASWCRLYL